MSTPTLVSRRALAILAAAMTAACHPEHFSATDSPDDATLELAFDCQYKRVPVKESCVVHGIVLLSTGEPADSGWVVDLKTSVGTLIPAQGSMGELIARMTTNGAGEVVVPYRAPADTGWAVFTLTSHGTNRKDSLRIFQPDLDVVDDPAVAAIILSPNTVSVKVGDSVLVAATFLDANQSKLNGRRAYFVVDNRIKAAVGSLPGDKAWVKGLDTGTTILRASRKAVLASVPVTISRP